VVPRGDERVQVGHASERLTTSHVTASDSPVGMVKGAGILVHVPSRVGDLGPAYPTEGMGSGPEVSV